MSYAPVMGIPRKGTKVRAVLDYFYEVGIASHEMALKELSDELTVGTIRAAIQRLRDSLLLTSCTGGLRLSVATKSMLDSEKAKADSSALVPPRQVNVLNTPPLNSKHFLKLTPNRDDGGDMWRACPSVNQPFSKSA